LVREDGIDHGLEGGSLAGALERPKGIATHLKRPYLVRKAVLGIWWYPEASQTWRRLLPLREGRRTLGCLEFGKGL
jgi:hypothetical protein